MATKDLKDYKEKDLLLVRKYCLEVLKREDTKEQVTSDKARTDAARLLAKIHDALSKDKGDTAAKLPKELQDILDGGNLKDDRMEEVASLVPNASEHTTP